MNLATVLKLNLIQLDLVTLLQGNLSFAAKAGSSQQGRSRLHLSLAFLEASESLWRNRKDKQKKTSVLHWKLNFECCSQGFLEGHLAERSEKYVELALLCATSGQASLQLTSPMLKLGLTSYGLTGLIQRQDNAGLEASLHW